MKILVTGIAGFIGFHLAKALLDRGDEIVGVDNLNNYYDPGLKQIRLDVLLQHPSSQNLTFIFCDISNRKRMGDIFDGNKFDVVVNLAAQAGVRYSLENPHSYINSNIVGFLNILEGCRNTKVKNLVYASSSSVYGMNLKQPFSTSDRVDHPVSLYAATKKSNELMAHSYSHLYDIPSTGLRFFTVYGPYGRPDMAYYKFTEAIMNGRPIEVYNNGVMSRDFTYIDDIVEGVMRVVDRPAKVEADGQSAALAPHKIYNIGNNEPVELARFISAIEESCGLLARKIHLPMQPGDVPSTYADVEELFLDVGYKPKTEIEVGISKFVEWYKDFWQSNPNKPK
jgi:UDP-glucuronate 4-epimerase